MSDLITYHGESLGSVHYFVYQEGKLPGRADDLFLRFINHNSLEKILTLLPEELVLVGDEEISVQKFKDEILKRCPYIGFENRMVATTKKPDFGDIWGYY